LRIRNADNPETGILSPVIATCSVAAVAVLVEECLNGRSEIRVSERRHVVGGESDG
jgi:hypothetical protein